MQSPQRPQRQLVLCVLGGLGVDRRAYQSFSTSSRMIVSSRSDPVETIAARTPVTSSSRAMYLRAASGSCANVRTPAVGAVHPGIDSYTGSHAASWPMSLGKSVIVLPAHL